MSHRARLTSLVVAVVAASAAVPAALGAPGAAATPAATRPAAAVSGADGTTAAGRVASAPSGPRLRRPDGPARPGSFAGRPPLARGSYFPVAVWYESVLSPADVQRDQDAGVNTYLELTENSDLDLVRRSGMRAMTTMRRHEENDGYLLPDEVDMWAGPGSSAWTGRWPGQGEICRPAGSWCGYTVVEEALRGVPDDEFVWGQFGKGVMMWQSRQQAQGFVNDGPDGVSADLYWYTDPNICGISEAGWFFGTDRVVDQRTCRRASNYGRTVTRLRSMVEPRGSKPVWVFVELGHPFTDDDAPTMTRRQIRDAVWSGLIHEARGVAYFNHNFGGPCQTQHLLRDGCGARIRPAVTRLNRQIARWSPLLNADLVDGLVTTSGPVDVSVRLWRDRFYLLVGRREDSRARGTVTLACGVGSKAVDVNTKARLPVVRRTLRIDVPRNQSRRILRLDRGRTCGLG